MIKGGGVSGLTTALLLHKQGIPFKVLEQKEKIGDYQSGLLLGANAVKILAEEFGVKDKLLEQGQSIEASFITDKKFKPRHKNFIPYIKDKTGHTPIVIDKKALLEILLNQLPQESIEIGTHVTGFLQNKQGVTLILPENRQVNGDFLISTDGMQSDTRKQLQKHESYRFTEQVWYHGISEYQLTPDYENTHIEAWCNQSKFGYADLGKGKVYWYALVREQDENLDEEHTMNQNLLSSLPDFSDPVSKIVKKTPESKIIRNESVDFKPINKYFKLRICLVGDAAHTSTPDLQQGGGQAIEDAYVITHCLNENANPIDAFRQFQEIRKEKNDFVVNESWKESQAFLRKNFIASIFNKLKWSLTLNSKLKKRYDTIYDMNYDL